MSDHIFYVGATGGKKKTTGYVPAKLLTVDGQPVVDPAQPAVRNPIRPLGIVTNEPTPDWPAPPPIFNTR
jgi:hypothetical protein